MTTEPFRLVLASRTRNTDAGHLAAADLASLAQELGVEYRLIGGNAVTLLTAVHGVMDRAPERETADADFGAERAVIATDAFVQCLRDHAYAQVEGNRFTRTIERSDGPLELAIDVLAPSHVGKLVSNQKHGDLYVDEVPALHLALARPPTLVNVEVRLRDGTELSYAAPLPDVVSALCMKAYAYRSRLLARDALDIWRLLEAANAAGITKKAWPPGGSATDAARYLNQSLREPGAMGLVDATHDSRQQTRIRALVARLIPAT